MLTPASRGAGTPTSSEDVFPLYYVTNVSTSEVVGRKTILQQMQEHLYNETVETQDVPSCFILHGIGGIGKTALAQHFCALSKPHFDAIFMVRAETETELQFSFTMLASLLRLEGCEDNTARTTQMVKNWFENTSKRLVATTVPLKLHC